MPLSFGKQSSAHRGGKSPQEVTIPEQDRCNDPTNTNNVPSTTYATAQFDQEEACTVHKRNRPDTTPLQPSPANPAFPPEPPSSGFALPLGNQEVESNISKNNMAQDSSPQTPEPPKLAKASQGQHQSKHNPTQKQAWNKIVFAHKPASTSSSKNQGEKSQEPMQVQTPEEGTQEHPSRQHKVQRAGCIEICCGHAGLTA